MRAAPTGDPGPYLEALEDLLHPPPVERAAPAEKERRIRGTRATLTEVADDRPAGGRPDRHDPLFGALTHDLDRAVRPEIAEADPGCL